jgi:hypothetical protein
VIISQTIQAVNKSDIISVIQILKKATWRMNWDA